MTKPVEQTVEYRCPGEDHPIPRAVHLGRLARFYAGCRQCPHRDDTGTLSARQVRRLIETRPRGLPRSLFHDEGAGGVYLNDLGPGAAREMAAALGVSLHRRITSEDDSHDHEGSDTSGKRPPVVAIGGDGRPMSGELVAAVAEGLRWAGCHVVDIGPASAACLALAIDHLRTNGGILVGNPADQPQTVGLKFWVPGSRPLSAGGALDSLRRAYQAGVDRPTRAYGSLRRFQAEVPYLAGLAEHYHALRPLRLILDTSCGPLAGYLKKLVEPVSCKIVSRRTPTDRLAKQVVAEGAHFAVRIDGDGETLHLLDEQGRRVATERLLLLVARHLTSDDPQGVIVLEAETAPVVAGAVRALGRRVVSSDPRRAAMAAAMQQHGARFGGGSSGRFWYTAAGPPLADALMTLTLLLVILSQSDRRLSEVLDREAAAG